ncbi:S-type anion channel SLAH2-like isoform X1 [Syzygium oleosum]|uniref:S-type anion channel SLAH2-like isoform X1 n=2 Tax=Syzygium oleosum TaxID=219896 RepID=UPI0011D27238|nr:S-type anion channel SLAH2-like isoform X1 [Syzygium oleosum]XP_056160172.1 S-type anion channel SLAH2-like isoform X1 [Syzygium oleosum]XP_056160174.1 S-type anion channel SLAH2-like isoform X1 [Syzygium oleosum]
MGSIEYQASTKQDSEETLPSLIQVISSNGIKGFDNVEANNNPLVGLSAQDTEAASSDDGSVVMSCERMQSISISMPPSPMEAHLHNAKRVLFSDHGDTIITNGNPDHTAPSNMDSKQTKFHSQPMPTGSAYREAVNGGNLPKHPGIVKDKRYDSFKTWSGKLERQLSNLRGKPRGAPSEDGTAPNAEIETLPVDRYFDALEGPELDTLRASEEIVLPDDKRWPFLLRFPISSFGICLGVSSQAIMWKTLATSASTNFLHINLTSNLILWCISVTLVAVVSSIYLLKVIFYFEAVRREYYHPIRVNFFFAPWIALLFLAQGVPPSVATNLHPALWYILMTPIFCLELKIYGQWMSGGQRRLSKVANPSNHLSIVGNFVGALLGASMGLKEGPLFFFAVGLAHYTVLFVTLYQRLPTNETLPKELHPVFFLFVAAPSVASMAWAKIQGSFDYGSRIAYFIALFLYFSLAVRVNFFRGFRFSLAWWAYTFPMTGAAIATTRYANEVTNVVTQALSVILSSIATLTVMALLVTTILHAFVLHDLFPNDIAIAISERKPKPHRKWFHLRHGSSDTRDIENYLKFACSESKDIEASLGHPSSDTDRECKLPL